MHPMQLAACIAILKSARQLGLVEDISKVAVTGGFVEIPQQIYNRAICHSAEELQTDAMQLICSSPKPTLVPSNDRPLVFFKICKPC